MTLSPRSLKSVLACALFLSGLNSICHAGLFDDEEARRAIIDLRQKFEVMEQARLHDKEAAQALDQALDAIVTLTDDDEGVPEISVFSDEGPPSVSLVRLNAFGDAIWAVYELSELWRSIGPRVKTVHRAPTPGRNEACFCGSGKKYKKCCLSA